MVCWLIPVVAAVALVCCCIVTLVTVVIVLIIPLKKSSLCSLRKQANVSNLETLTYEQELLIYHTDALQIIREGQK